MREEEITRGGSGGPATGPGLMPYMARVSGDQNSITLGHQTAMRASEGEDWKVPSDHSSGHLFEDWWEALPDAWPGTEPYKRCAREAWQASITHHCATLRRVGWLDQKGRVWISIPDSRDFDGGSLTPLLIDVRET